MQIGVVGFGILNRETPEEKQNSQRKRTGKTNHYENSLARRASHFEKSLARGDFYSARAIGHPLKKTPDVTGKMSTVWHSRL